jgi:hypothetical protein
MEMAFVLAVCGNNCGNSASYGLKAPQNLLTWRKRCLKVPMCAFGKHWVALGLLKQIIYPA